MAAVIPSAGASTRFHGFPKACLRVGDETAIVRIVRMALEAECSPVVVVAGPHSPEIQRALGGAPVHLVRHTDWARGRTGSIQAGLQEVPDGDDVLLWPVDHPFVDAKSLAALSAAQESDDLAVWFIPMYLGQGGHPVYLRAAARPAVQALGPSDPLRRLLPELGPQVRRIPVADPGVVENCDTPEAYGRYLERWRSAWTDG